MKIDSTLAAPASRYETQRQADKHVQDVFSEVLAAAGREGYASAEPLETEEPLTASITESWESWFRGTGILRYGDFTNREQLAQSFGQILVSAQEQGGYVAPRQFLSSLEPEQLEAVQYIHRLVSPIQPEKLTDEGALNLLLPPSAQVDANNDGLTQSGIGYGIRFPDSRTPPEVVAAWDEIAPTLDEGERMLRQLQIKLPVLLANIHIDADGKYVGTTEPGDAGFVNPLANADYSYVGDSQEHLDSLEAFKAQLGQEQYDRDKAFWTQFKSLLQEHGAK